MQSSSGHWTSIPFYIFFIIQPNGNTAYIKQHEKYPLSISSDQLIGLISLFSTINNLQKSITPSDVIANRKDEIDFGNRSAIKSLNTNNFQIRVFETISEYRFVVLANNNIDSKKLDSKL